MSAADATDLNLGLVGNCTFSALINQRGRILWSCFPRFDGDPVFCSLLNPNVRTEKLPSTTVSATEKTPAVPRRVSSAAVHTGTDVKDQPGLDRGFWDIEIEDFDHSEQEYVHNSAILITRVYDKHGGAFEITDFAPRFFMYGRTFRPLQLFRMLRPLSGQPRVCVRIRPTYAYGELLPKVTRGSNHVRYEMDELTLRLTTDVPISMVVDEVHFLLTEPKTLVLGPDESLKGSPAAIAREFREKTQDYWQCGFTRYLSIPPEYQEVVIRGAITCKLCQWEESGAIIAAQTTSIPETDGSGRNWDYRFCWLRDAYFVVGALNRLGVTRTMEEYIRFLQNIVASSPDGKLQPLYGIAMETKMPELHCTTLDGYRGNGPVRVGNEAYEQIQHDVYGSVVLACAQLFFDERIIHPGTQQVFEMLEKLGEQAMLSYDQFDAGLWEFRGIAKVHTFSSVMCWAACDRLGRIAEHLGDEKKHTYWRDNADRIKKVIMEKCWDEKQNSFVDAFGGSVIDASLLLLCDLGFVDGKDPKYIGTVEAVERTLKRGDHIFRYAEKDDFGYQENGFNICTCWYINALHHIGKTDEARALFEKFIKCRNHLGLMSEDTTPKSGELWGNFPQTYSMVGMINCALNLSKQWSDVV